MKAGDFAMSLVARIACGSLHPFLVSTLLVSAGPALAQEEGPVPGSIPDPSTYQGSMEQQRQSDEQDQQSRGQMQEQQQSNNSNTSSKRSRRCKAMSLSPPIRERDARSLKAPSHRAGPKDRHVCQGDQAQAIHRALRLAGFEALAGDASAAARARLPLRDRERRSANHEIAASWNRKQRTRAIPGGQADLGWMYFKGLGVPRDPVQACSWLVLAGRENMNARRHMAEVQAAITYDQMSQGLSLAQQWTPIVSEH